MSDDGPVAMIQIENEYGHVGGRTGEEGEAHMRMLRQVAKEVGLKVPIYTATGWGGAVTGGMLPVMGGYCEAPLGSAADRNRALGGTICSRKKEMITTSAPTME